ncbi:sialic acid-binding Ig-like lectin 5 isoform X2 [Nycticebus coucang]|uniref:sialic acid-binding Ig-like lectin 5 isoform X2 n=1 Tax=Nycticebus coucang TaxID=9470 RepID=UPI00234C476C|nr:sialic acid-binding Ig-like lectin 5 isoform X2 [Nycticebus coucang]
MLALLLLPLLWGGSLQVDTGFKVQVPNSVTGQEGLCVLVPCFFSFWSQWSSSPPLYIHWFRDADHIYFDDAVATNDPDRTVKTQTRGRFLLRGNIRNGNCSLSIKNAKIEDRGSYFLQMEKENGVKYNSEERVNLQVTALTEKPAIHFLEPLESGHPTQLSCSLPGSCPGGRPLRFSWTGGVLQALDSGTLHSSAITLTPRPQDHGTNLTCQVKLQNSHVATERTVQLNVTSLKILQNSSSLSVLEGQTLRLLCAADSNPPARLSWFQASPALNATPIFNTGVLMLPQVKMEHEGEFTCHAEHLLGSQHISLSLSVHYPPQLLGPSCSWEAQGLRCSCCFRAQPAPSLRWWLGEGLQEGTSSQGSTTTNSSAGPWVNSSLSLHGELTSSLRLSCEARNNHGAQKGTILLLPGKSVMGVGVVPAALAGAGAMALFSVCLCLIFLCIVKVQRKQAAGRPERRDDEDPVMGTVAWGSRQKPWPDNPPDQESTVRDTQPLGEQDLYYASVSFQEMKARKPQDQKATCTTEYSEIKPSK